MTANDGWDTLDDAMSQLVITDICILSRKEKAQTDYVVVGHAWLVL